MYCLLDSFLAEAYRNLKFFFYFLFIYLFFCTSWQIFIRTKMFRRDDNVLKIIIDPIRACFKETNCNNEMIWTEV